VIIALTMSKTLHYVRQNMHYDVYFCYFSYLFAQSIFCYSGSVISNDYIQILYIIHVTRNIWLYKWLIISKHNVFQQTRMELQFTYIFIIFHCVCVWHAGVMLGHTTCHQEVPSLTVHACTSFINQYNLTQAKDRWRSAAALHKVMRFTNITYTVPQKTVQNYFCQNFVGRKDKLIWGALTSHLTLFMWTHYRVERRCSKLLDNAVIISLQ